MSIAEQTGPLALTPEWYEARKHCIGASEAAAACGLSPYATPLDIYLRKRGEIAEVEDNDAMRLGRLLEPVVLSEYARRIDVAVIPNARLFISPTHQFIGATPDGFRDDDGRPIDAKTTTHWTAKSWGEPGTDDIPADYVCQAQQQMFVVGAAVQDVAVLIDGRTLRIYTVHRNDRLIDGMLAKESELWERIVAGEPPEPDWSHSRTPDLVRQMYGVTEGATIPLSDETAKAWAEYERLGAAIRDMEKERAALQARVLHAMGDKAIGYLPDGERELARTIVAGSTFTVHRKESIRLTARKVKTK